MTVQKTTCSIQRAKLMLDRARSTSGYYRWTAHNPPPSVQEMAEVMEQLVQEQEQYESPAWRANTSLNARLDICYLALEAIAEEAPEKFAKLAKDTLEAAANVPI